MNIAKRTEEILKSTYHTDLKSADRKTLYNAVSVAAMDKIYDKWSKNRGEQAKGRQACYLSAEFLIGRMIYNNLLNLGVLSDVEDMLKSVGRDISEFEEIEDAALGNGGLGRLAACFLDSAATLQKPVIGYGIRYKYGLFKQSFKDGFQVEEPDDWQRFGDPWAHKREDLKYEIRYKDQTVYAVAHDIPVIPYGGKCINTLRLFEAQSGKDFDFDLFNQQKYEAAVKDRLAAERIHYVLYPNDDQKQGKILRLKQEYFFTSAAVQDMLQSFEKNVGTDYVKFSDYFAVQLNDTHPVLAILELINQLMARNVEFDSALNIAKSTFSYTNHTIMAEALEKWDIKLFKSVLPDLYKLATQINKQLSKELKSLKIDDEQIKRMQIIDGNVINMAHLAIYVGNATNGVAQIHTEIIKHDVLKDWYSVYPDRFNNKTNGITPRRWLRLCNPQLSQLISEKIGDKWVTDLDELKKLESYANDEDFINRFYNIKLENKKRLAEYILKNEGVEINTNSIFDIQIKRLHEYKRQLLNAFSALYIYFGIKDGSIKLSTPLTILFGAKAAPGYKRAKGIIKFINEIAKLVSNDPDTKDLLKVHFVKNYNVSYAELLVTAADISEQISTAGTEALGTGNMKFMLNGTVTLGTLDGANVEIVEAAGEQNNYIFGNKVEQIEKLKKNYDPKVLYNSDAKLKRVLDTLSDGTLSDEGTGIFKELYDALLKGASWHQPDHYFLLADFDSYVKTKLKCISDYEDRNEFMKKCIINMANAGRFSSDRTILEYCRDIWHV
ncbi:MAG: glycogen/starch/alpha-glucan phosphorylase [Clostridia bacterium]|nr:glycogen/starch/alpha-glucan phosphorylase [Clostridia bacterium]